MSRRETCAWDCFHTTTTYTPSILYLTQICCNSLVINTLLSVRYYQFLPTRNLHNPHAATRHKHGRVISRHRGAEKSVAPTDCSTSLWRIIPLHTSKPTARQRGVMCKMYAGECMILWTYLTLLSFLNISMLRIKSVRWQWNHTLSFTSRLTGSGQTIV